MKKEHLQSHQNFTGFCKKGIEALDKVQTL